MARQEILLKSGATLIVDRQHFRRARRIELTRKIGYSKRHITEDKRNGIVDQVEIDRQAELVLQREGLR